MKIATDHKDYNNLATPFVLVLFGYFALHIALRVALSGSLDYDEAEQALLGQWLLAGYTEQPPLYTWLQHFLFTLFGKNVFAVSFLKNGLLLLTYISVFFAAREILEDDRPAILAAASLLLIPQIGWESQRDMTHTTLAVFAAAATLWQVMRLIKHQSFVNYCILGLLLGTGILAKANFFLFVAVLLLTLSSFSEGRKVLFSRNILVSLVITAAFTGTYVLWMTNNQDIVFSATHKFKREIENYWLKGTVNLIEKSFHFLTPLWFICLCLFPAGFALKGKAPYGFRRQIINRYLLVLFFALFVAVIAGKVTYVKDRWLQPLLFVAPIFFFARLAKEAITPQRFKLFLQIVGAAALIVYTTFTFRVVGASYTGSFCRLNYPFTSFTEDLRRLGFTGGLIISDDRFIAGNLHFHFPDSTALVPNYRFERLVDDNRYAEAAAVWQSGPTIGIPTDLKDFLINTYGIEAADYPVHSLQQPYLFSRGETVTLAVIIFPLTGSRQTKQLAQ